MKIIECLITNAIGLDESWEGLEIAGFESGIKIDVQNFKPIKDGFLFNLLVGYQLPFDFGESFKNIINGMVLTLESPDSGAVGLLRLSDPNVSPAIPNFSGSPLDDENVTSCFGERFGFQMAVKKDSELTDLIYLRVCMQNLLSNCISIRPATGDVINYG